MEKIINGIKFNVVITRKKIKNIYLRLDGNNINVSANQKASINDIDLAIDKHEKWIIDHYHKQQEINYKDLTKGYIYILKEKYEAHIYLSKVDIVIVRNSVINIFVKKDDPKHVEKVFYNYTDKYLYQIVDELNDKWKQTFNRDPIIEIKKLKSKWGACYPKENRIVLSSYLIHYSRDAIDSVLLHEYVHFKVFNHSKAFYDTINLYMSDYQKIAKELK